MTVDLVFRPFAGDWQLSRSRPFFPPKSAVAHPHSNCRPANVPLRGVVAELVSQECYGPVSHLCTDYIVMDVDRVNAAKCIGSPNAIGECADTPTPIGLTIEIVGSCRLVPQRELKKRARAQRVVSSSVRSWAAFL